MALGTLLWKAHIGLKWWTHQLLKESITWLKMKSVKMESLTLDIVTVFLMMLHGELGTILELIAINGIVLT